ncbi:hypothetical protein [Crocosphaera chwakensis]|uniref:Uncharacterized protein n=1 Tax=Crocosphaera chwakensis CCY0110 TaxID=391612 RepID=A3ITD7_9CHRO|nr:hypothetical protein [Crocosphaera chwakensis]EAZ90222.1 hypothetical protein CY0110_04403 [Crocosphaera chwakensis CCY0110]
MNNDFNNPNDDDLENLERLEAHLREIDSRLSELQENRQQLDNQLKVRNFMDKLRDVARQADQQINSLNFRERFCLLYRQWLTRTVSSSIDLLNLASLAATVFFGLNLPILTASFSAIGIMRRLSDNYCNDIMEDKQEDEQ